MITYDEIIALLSHEEYEYLLMKLNKSLEDDSDNPMYYYYRFLAINKDYIHMDFNDLNQVMDLKKAIDLSIDSIYEVEFKFFRLLKNTDRRVFFYALRMNENKLNSIDRNNLDKDLFSKEEEVNLLKDFVDSLNHNTQKKLVKQILIDYEKLKSSNPFINELNGIIYELDEPSLKIEPTRGNEKLYSICVDNEKVADRHKKSSEFFSKLKKKGVHVGVILMKLFLSLVPIVWFEFLLIYGFTRNRISIFSNVVWNIGLAIVGTLYLYIGFFILGYGIVDAFKTFPKRLSIALFAVLIVILFFSFEAVKLFLIS